MDMWGSEWAVGVRVDVWGPEWTCGGHNGHVRVRMDM